MTQENPPSKLLRFFIVWLGQLVSTIGSNMSGFAIQIWTWEITGKATSLALVGFFTLFPSILITPFSGIIVDRYNRKFLMIVGDTIAFISTIVILLLYLNKDLQIWHLYFTGAVVGTFNQFQSLAYSASVSLMVPKQYYTRASSMEFLSAYGANIVAPGFAGYLYYLIGLTGILLIDILTFAIAISSVLLIHIPNPPSSWAEHQNYTNIWQQLGFGWRYIKANKGLLALLLTTLLFWLFHDIGNVIYSPMILARTGNNTVVLGSLASAAGLGGVMGALIFSAWGGPKRRIKGVLFGMMGAALSKIIFGIGRTPLIWIPAQFCSSINFPVSGSSETAIWLAKVSPNIQGRVFATRSLFLQLVAVVAYLVAGFFADNVFEPNMMPGGNLTFIFGGLFGTGKGSGMALIYVLCAFSMLLVSLCAYSFRLLRNLENIVSDGDTSTV